MARNGRHRTDESWRRLRFEAGRLFTPSTPIGIADLFSGRLPQIRKLEDTVAERGRHALVYGEPGVGKTSLAQIIQYLIPSDRSKIRYIKKSAFSADTYSTIWMSIFHDMQFTADLGNGNKKHSVSEIYKIDVHQ